MSDLAFATEVATFEDSELTDHIRDLQGHIQSVVEINGGTATAAPAELTFFSDPVSAYRFGAEAAAGELADYLPEGVALNWLPPEVDFTVLGSEHADGLMHFRELVEPGHLVFGWVNQSKHWFDCRAVSVHIHFKS